MRILILLGALLLAPKGFSASVPLEESDRLEEVFLTGKFADDTTKGLDTLFQEATDQLRKKGYNNEADQISSDWAYRYRDFLLQPNTLKDIGDHQPIQWLYDTWKQLDTLLGHTFMVMSHLDDLYEFAYTIPVVFRCEDNVDAVEYSKHFTVFSGAVAYWVSMATCAAALFGSPYALICSPVGDVCEWIVKNRIAPRISNRVWEKVCQ